MTRAFVVSARRIAVPALVPHRQRYRLGWDHPAADPGRGAARCDRDRIPIRSAGRSPVSNPRWDFDYAASVPGIGTDPPTIPPRIVRTRTHTSPRTTLTRGPTFARSRYAGRPDRIRRYLPAARPTGDGRPNTTGRTTREGRGAPRSTKNVRRPRPGMRQRDAVLRSCVRCARTTRTPRLPDPARARPPVWPYVLPRQCSAATSRV